MRSQIILSLEQFVREELVLQRRLGACRRAASALMPTLRRTGMDKVGMDKKRPPMPTPRGLKVVDDRDPPPLSAAPRQSGRD